MFNMTKSENQLDLGRFIEKLEQMDPDHDVTFEFASLEPTDFDSYRGYYSDLALGFTDGATTKTPLVKDLLTLAKEAVGKTFEGYKGGSYKMGVKTPLWVANYGQSGSTAIVDVVNIGWKCVIKTEFIDD